VDPNADTLEVNPELLRRVEAPESLRSALQVLHGVCVAMDLVNQMERPTEDQYQAALAQASCALKAIEPGRKPEAVVGDFDSISAHAQATLGPARLFPIREQMTTDFDKALRSVAAPFTLALGFTGARVDHGLAVFNSLVRHADRHCIVIGPRDVIFHAPPELILALTPGDRLSLFPMSPVTGRSSGLEWPIDGLDFAPAGVIGTSNRVTSAKVHLEIDSPGMLVILPRARLDCALRSLLGAAWQPPAALPAR
jgi:thiamine pyrophosphokinase